MSRDDAIFMNAPRRLKLEKETTDVGRRARTSSHLSSTSPMIKSLWFQLSIRSSNGPLNAENCMACVVMDHDDGVAATRSGVVRRPRVEGTSTKRRARACVIVTCSSRIAWISSTPLSTPVPVSL